MKRERVPESSKMIIYLARIAILAAGGEKACRSGAVKLLGILLLRTSENGSSILASEVHRGVSAFRKSLLLVALHPYRALLAALKLSL